MVIAGQRWWWAGTIHIQGLAAGYQVLISTLNRYDKVVQTLSMNVAISSYEFSS